MPLDFPLSVNDKKTIEQVVFDELKSLVFRSRAVFFSEEFDNGNSGTAKTIDWKSGNKQKITLTGDATIAFSNPYGVCNLILRCIEDGTARTISWDSNIKWSGSAPTFTGTVNKWYVLSFYFDGSSYSGFYSQEIG